MRGRALALVCAVCGGGSQLTIDGKDFQKDAKVELDCGGQTFTANTVTVNADATQLVATELVIW